MLFIKHSLAGGVAALLIYVDNIIMIGNYEREKHELKLRLVKEIKMKEVGKPK